MSLNDVHISRRAFLQGFAAVTLVATSPFHAFAGSQSSHGEQLLMGTRKTSVGAYDLSSHALRETDIGFFTHSLIQNPANPRQIVAIEKWGPGLAVLDLDEMRVVQQLPAEKGTAYYGHGFYVNDGKVFFITRVSENTGLGHFIGFDAETLKPVIDYQVTPGGLHECSMVDENTAMVASAGVRNAYRTHVAEKIEPSGLIRVDMKTGKVTDKMFIDNNVDMLAHFRKSVKGTIIAINGTRPTEKDKAGKLYYSKDGKAALRALELPEDVTRQMKGTMLSVAFSDDGNMAAVTSPYSHEALIIDADTGHVKQVIRDELYGVAYDHTQREFIFDNKDKISYFDDKRSTLVNMSVEQQRRANHKRLLAHAHCTIV
jgi:hypothetical protein